VGCSSDRPLVRKRLSAADLAEAWEEHAEEWVAWARAAGHDSYQRFHRDLFLPLLPAPGRATLDLGCGEGRLSADLARLGHAVVGVDRSRAMIAAARAARPELDFREADAEALPFLDQSFDCVVAFMSLQDTDDVRAAIRESGRVLAQGGRFCFAVVHPLNSAGSFAADHADSAFFIEGSYLDESYYVDSLSRGGLEMTFVSKHRPLAVYADALADAGLLVERLSEPPVPDTAATDGHTRRWRRIPLFLHGRAVKLTPNL
jgi:SAM-dependent methyltransferase